MIKCELHITRLHGADEGKIVRIEARDGAKLLSRVEIGLEDFAAAVMGLGAVPAQFTTTRNGLRIDRTDPEGGIPGRAHT